MIKQHRNLLLFILTTLIWSTTWLGIRLQIGYVPEAWSVAYRFGLAALLLGLYCQQRQLPMRFTGVQHAQLALQGLLLFCLNYLLFYYGSRELLSGVMALLFSSILVFNIINARIIIKRHISKRVLLGALLGLFGIGLAMLNEMQQASALHHLSFKLISTSLGIGLIATYISSLGNIVALQNQLRGLPLWQSTCIAMAYGALFAGLINLMHGSMPVFDFSFNYVSSLIYLAACGSVLGFIAYIRLLHQMGPERASYVFVVLPFFAMLLSSAVEGLQWRPLMVYGLLLAALGNYFILSPTPKRQHDAITH